MAKRGTVLQRRRAGFRHATNLVRDVCLIAGVPSLVEDARSDLETAGVRVAVEQHDTATLFGWLMDAISYQGISDAAALAYMNEHGRVDHQDVVLGLGRSNRCQKLSSWWHFENCGYRKTARSCNESGMIESCALPTHDLRNGALNQAAYGLALFLRDVAGGDLVEWLDHQLEHADRPLSLGRGKAMAASVIEPLRHVHGLSDKVLSMSLSTLLLASDPDRERWIAAGASMIAIDTLVHNWLVRTGVLSRLGSDHPYGARCYGPDGCASIIEHVSRRIDATAFNAEFPKVFPRFVQHAIWRFCAQSGLDICNGNRIQDRGRCQRFDCDLFAYCDRKTLNASPARRAPSPTAKAL